MVLTAAVVTVPPCRDQNPDRIRKAIGQKNHKPPQQRAQPATTAPAAQALNAKLGEAFMGPRSRLYGIKSGQIYRVTLDLGG